MINAKNNYKDKTYRAKNQPFPYDDFQGIDSSRDQSSLDTGQMQHLFRMENAYANFRGIIHRDRDLQLRTNTPPNKVITHVTFYGRDLVAWAQRDGGGITLGSDPNELYLPEAFTPNSVVTSTVFNNELFFFSRDQIMARYNGAAFSKSSQTREKPAFGIAVQRRLAIAGQNSKRSIIELSRVDDPTIFSTDELTTDTSVTKASDIDVQNIIGTADEIKGLGVFETNKLAVFTNDRAIVYTISPDYTKWAIDDKTSVNVGTLSHNTIANVGTDIIFCSRHGVYSLRRSESNGITIYAVPLSSKIEEIYKTLVATVPNKENISAYFDQDYGQYHIFFPQTDFLTTRLTMTLNPMPGGEPKWSTANYLNQRCGASLGGVTAIGTSGGIYNVLDYEHNEELTDIYSPNIDVMTPILWHGSLTETKTSKEFIIQAAGEGHLSIFAYNEEDQLIQTFEIDLEQITGGGDDNYFSLPLSKQYNRQFAHQYKGVKFRIKATSGHGRLKIIGFAVIIDGTE